MSNPLTLRNLTIERPSSGAHPAKYTLFLSDGTKTELLGSFTDTEEQAAMAIANRLLDLNTITYEHAILAGHIKVLAKWKRAVKHFDRNSLHREHDLDGTEFELTKPESANLTFLRYHGLLVKDKEAAAGYWVLTRRGNEFLRGERTIPKHAVVKNNEVIGHEGPEVEVTDVWRDAPHWPSRDELVMQRQAPREQVQGALL